MPKVALIKVWMPALDPTDDPATNGFVFLGSGATDFTSISDLFTHVLNFYNTHGTGGTHPISYYLGAQLDRAPNHCTISAYDITGHLNGTPHGSPVAVQNWTLGASAATEVLPSGVAAAVSFRADYGTDVEFGPHTRPRARDRNKVFVGPINLAAISSDSTTNRCILSVPFVTDALAALFDLSEVVDETGADWVLQVWSRVNAATKLAVEGFMDNRPDYQRRRSDPAPAARTFRALSAV